jgi:adenosylcobinamide-GDP ribazoletransferase
MKMDRHYSGAILAFQFLTRLPMPRTEHFSSTDLSRSSLYFPLVGLVLGVMLAVILMLASTRGRARCWRFFSGCG